MVPFTPYNYPRADWNTWDCILICWSNLPFQMYMKKFFAGGSQGPPFMTTSLLLLNICALQTQLCRTGSGWWRSLIWNSHSGWLFCCEAVVLRGSEWLQVKPVRWIFSCFIQKTRTSDCACSLTHCVVVSGPDATKWTLSDPVVADVSHQILQDLLPIAAHVLHTWNNVACRINPLVFRISVFKNWFVSYRDRPTRWCWRSGVGRSAWGRS